MSYRKLMRTLQSYFPPAAELKSALYRAERKLLQKPHEVEFEILKYLRFSDDECLVDVGANQGQSIESIRLFNKMTPLIAFEPNSLLAARLKRRYAKYASQTEIRACGLSDVHEAKELHVPVYRGYVYDGLASFDRSAAEGWLNSTTVFLFSEKRLHLNKLPCDVETLDEQKLAPGFIKVDVQGLECKVIKGGLATLKAFEPVLLLESPGQSAEMEHILRRLGYSEFRWERGRLHAGRGNSWMWLFLTARRLRDLPNTRICF
jgi:FkbM family methyltransferase